MITYNFTCEGCDKKLTTDSGKLPHRWKHVWTNLNFWESYTFLLCGECCDAIGRYSFFKATIMKLKSKLSTTKDEGRENV